MRPGVLWQIKQKLICVTQKWYILTFDMKAGNVQLAIVMQQQNASWLQLGYAHQQAMPWKKYGHFKQSKLGT